MPLGRWETVQNTFKMLKLSISEHIRPKNKNYHLRTHPENVYFSTFYDFHGVQKALPGGVLSKNSY